jgi:hypothetical protein
MFLSNSKIIPAAFWVGFLALGFVTSLVSPNKHRAERLAQPANPVVEKSLVAESVKKLDLRAGAVAARN